MLVVQLDALFVAKGLCRRPSTGPGDNHHGRAVALRAEEALFPREVAVLDGNQLDVVLVAALAEVAVPTDNKTSKKGQLSRFASFLFFALIA